MFTFLHENGDQNQNIRIANKSLRHVDELKYLGTNITSYILQ
jgi:hypothetical protein